MERILQVVYDNYKMADEREITIEVNPGTVSLDKLQAYYHMGINRLSIGLQSAQDNELKLLGRIHTAADFFRTYENAVKSGFNNINVDLMSAIPSQTVDSYKETLYKVLSLKPQPAHISAYSLIIEEGTPFYENTPELPDEETDRLMYKITDDILEENGYHRYEISNYALKDHECRHNQVYWERGEYLGLGLGASSFLRLETVKQRKEKLPYCQEVRFKNNSNLYTYLQGDFSYEEEIELSRREAMEEFFFLGLRRMKGVSLIAFAEEFGEDTIDWFDKAISQSIKDGLLEQEGGILRLTPKGIDVSNFVFERFLE